MFWRKTKRRKYKASEQNGFAFYSNSSFLHIELRQNYHICRFVGHIPSENRFSLVPHVFRGLPMMQYNAQCNTPTIYFHNTFLKDLCVPMWLFRRMNALMYQVFMIAKCNQRKMWTKTSDAKWKNYAFAIFIFFCIYSDKFGAIISKYYFKGSNFEHAMSISTNINNSIAIGKP